MQPLAFPENLYEQVLRHCRERYKKEACGLLAGRKDPAPDGRRLVVAVYPMTNVEDSPIGYAMDPKEQLRVEKDMRLRGQALLGIYHSHTATRAYPSPVDVAHAISPDIAYVLISLKDFDRPVMKSYRINGSRVEPEPDPLVEPAASGSARPA